MAIDVIQLFLPLSSFSLAVNLLRVKGVKSSGMAEDPSGWALTESDPQVFTQLLRDLGVKGLQVVSPSLPHGYWM